jgi:hypothetical protein
VWVALALPVASEVVEVLASVVVFLCVTTGGIEEVVETAGVELVMTLFRPASSRMSLPWP